MDNGNISLRFWHPSRNIEFLSDLFNLPCFRNWVAGSRRNTPKGTPLPGVNQESYWVSRVTFSDSKRFKNELLFLLDLLSKNASTVSDLQSSGGRIEIYLCLPGKINIGGNIESNILSLMGKIGVDLLIEVFPTI